MHTHAPAAASQPQYALVARKLIDDIEQGRYPVGSLLPPELDLCTQFGVSRHTIREAIRRLQDYGLVTRQRGVGTEVRTDRVEPRYVQSTTSIADLLQYVEDTRLVMHASKDVIADAALAGLLACPVGQRWRQLSGHRYAGRGKLPIALTDVYINAAYSGIETLIGTLKVPVYRLIEATYGESVAEVQQTIRAVTIRTANSLAPARRSNSTSSSRRGCRCGTGGPSPRRRCGTRRRRRCHRTRRTRRPGRTHACASTRRARAAS